ncbi:MAG: hypothetical protein WCJ18_08550 [Planctomycetota bacterium]
MDVREIADVLAHELLPPQGRPAASEATIPFGEGFGKPAMLPEYLPLLIGGRDRSRSSASRFAVAAVLARMTARSSALPQWSASSAW